MKQYSLTNNCWQQSFGKCDHSGKRRQQDSNINQNQASSSSFSNRHIKQHSPEKNYWTQPFGKFDDSGKRWRQAAHSNQNQSSSLKFSGMNLGDVMKITVMEEMKNLKMSKDVPLDLSLKS